MAKRGSSDDFEFKPLTEGLGFHKKKLELKEDLAAQLNQASTGDIMPKPRTQTPLFHMSNPLGAPTRPARDEIKEKPAAPKKQDDKPSWSPALSQMQITETVEPTYKPVATGWAAGFFDALMVLGIGLIFTAVVFAVTGIDFDQLSALLSKEFGAQLAMMFLFFAVLELYGVSSRVLFGATLGEWAFGLRMGTEEDQKSFLFPIKLTWRIFLSALTGFILLPLLSTFLETDVAGKLSGLELYSEEL